MDIGVRELKEHLSEYLDRAADGEVIRVTDRGQPKALLGPLPGATQLREGIAAKWIRAAEDEPPRRVQRHQAVRLVAEVLREDRGT